MPATQANQPSAITLSQLNTRIQALINGTPSLQSVWVVAETIDVQVKGHCYLELVEKDSDGRPVARMRATIWQSVFNRLNQRFLELTGRYIGNDLKVLVCGSVNFHPQFGMSFNIHDIDATYSVGDLLRRRAQSVERLTREGVIELNRQLPLPTMAYRIAVISGDFAAGLGDFMKQLYEPKTNPSCIRFVTKLFKATMQGEKAPQSIIYALDRIAAEADNWDMVAIVRGGGATIDLGAFEDYNLAANVAQFPIPVLIGLGHDRDITLLDYVARWVEKTPTAAGAWLVARGNRLITAMQTRATKMMQLVGDRLGECHRKLAYISGQLPAATANALMRSKERINSARLTLAAVAERRIVQQNALLDNRQSTLADAVTHKLESQRQRIDATTRLLDAISPQATLSRGYSITRVGGKAVRDASEVIDGEVIETTLASGTLYSKRITDSV